MLTTVFADARAQSGVQNFYTEWLGLQTIPYVNSNRSMAYLNLIAGTNVGTAGHDVRGDMIKEIQELTKYYTFTTSGKYENLLTSQYSFAKSSDLASIYGVAPWDGTASHLVPFSSGQRSGLISRGAFLISGTEYTSPIHKGHRVRSEMLCDVISPPPAALKIVPLVQDTVHTTRVITEQDTAATTCLQCHGPMNPLGFNSENYDSIGRYRTLEQKFDPATGAFVSNIPVATQAEVSAFPGDTRFVNDAVDLGSYIAQTGKGHQCFVRQYFRYTFGRVEDLTNDACSMESMRNYLMNPTDGTLLQMFRETARQQPFRNRKVQ